MAKNGPFKCGVYPVYVPGRRNQLSPPMATLMGPPPLRATAPTSSVVRTALPPPAHLNPVTTKVDPPAFDPSKRDHRHDVRMFPVLAGARAAALASIRAGVSPTPRRRAATPAAMPAVDAVGAHREPVESRWFDEPAVVGLALMLLPPLGMTLLWTNPRFSSSARVVLTLFTTFSALIVAALVVRR